MARFTLRLYISGTTPQSQKAVATIHRICESYLAGRFHLEIIDIYQSPGRAKDDRIIAVPTLVKASPAPLRLLLGDLSDEKRVLAGLGLDISDLSPQKKKLGSNHG